MSNDVMNNWMKEQAMSQTPETDEQINGKPCTRFAIMAGDSLRDALVPAEFARKLERGRNEARQIAERLRKYATPDLVLPWEC